MYKILASIFFCLLMTLPAYSLDIVTNNLDVALKKAEVEKRNVLCIFSIKDCDYCDKLKNYLDTSDIVSEYIVCLIDTKHNTDTKRLTSQLNVKKWPTSIIFMSTLENRGEVSRKVGFKSNKDYENWLIKNGAVFQRNK